MSILNDPEFIKHLDAWTFNNKQSDANWIYARKSKIPSHFTSYTDFLYRGMIVDDDFMSKLKEGNLKLEGFSSWSKDRKVSEKFVKDEKYKTTNKSGIQIIIKKKMTTTQVIFDIDKFVEFMGVQQLIMLGYDDLSVESASIEKEVLINKGILIKEKDVIVL